MELEQKAVRQADLSNLFGNCPIPITDYKEVTLAYGSGGKLTQRLIEKMIKPQFSNELLDPLHDGAMFSVNNGRMAFSTDSYVVNPIFFPGGDIGELAVNGTVNDLAMCGAKARYLSVGFIIEEGFLMRDLWRVILSMKRAAGEAGVMLVTGDTKVVDRGKGDQLYINTSGIGIIPEHVHIHPSQVKPGDKVIVNGPIAVHGIAIMSVRAGLEFETAIESDTAPLNGLVERILEYAGDVHMMRDATRGGLTGVLTEIAGSSSKGIQLEERMIPLDEDVKGACEILGLDPLYVANEGKMIAIVSPHRCEEILKAMRTHPLGESAAVIGEITEAHPGTVTMKTAVGGTRIVDMLSGEQLPRIC